MVIHCGSHRKLKDINSSCYGFHHNYIKKLLQDYSKRKFTPLLFFINSVSDKLSFHWLNTLGTKLSLSHKVTCNIGIGRQFGNCLHLSSSSILHLGCLGKTVPIKVEEYYSNFEDFFFPSHSILFYAVIHFNKLKNWYFITNFHFSKIFYRFDLN